MRDSFSSVAMPLTEEVGSIMSGNAFNGNSGNILTNVSSEAYYGYQPQVHMYDKHFMQDSQCTEQRLPNFEKCHMDTTQCNSEPGNFPNPNRKRHWEGQVELPESKKCRPNEYDKDNKKNSLREDEERKILEDILKETHGVSIYHWFSSEA